MTADAVDPALGPDAEVIACIRDLSGEISALHADFLARVAPLRRSRAVLIRQLLAGGWSYRRLARTLQISTIRIQQIAAPAASDQGPGGP